jgi:hypothetical protein
VAYATMTLMGFRPFQDAQGRVHGHDPNQHRMAMRCEAGQMGAALVRAVLV